MENTKQEKVYTDENLKLSDMIAHRDFLMQLIAEQDKRIRQMKTEMALEAQDIGQQNQLTQQINTLSETPGVKEFLEKQNLQDNLEVASEGETDRSKGDV